jgi:hypothetical protein
VLNKSLKKKAKLGIMAYAYNCWGGEREEEGGIHNNPILNQ